MQDNAPAHAAKETKQLLADLAINRFEWPPYSPDLNPIETLWKYMKNFL
jgi:transposase